MRPPIVACGWMFERKCGADYASSRTGWCTRQDGRMATVHAGYTNRITNLRRWNARTGKRKKQITKQVKAAALHAPKTRSRSHLLTVIREHRQYKVRISTQSRSVNLFHNNETYVRCMTGLHVTITAVQDSGLITSANHVSYHVSCSMELVACSL